jgi:hypothetical protein
VLSDLTKECTDDDKKTERYKLLADFADDPITECQQTIVAPVAQGRLTFDAVAADACASAAEKARTPEPGGHLAIPDLDEIPECKTIVSAKQGLWAMCMSSLECTGQLTCVGAPAPGDKSPKQGACAPMPSKAGEACDAVYLKLHDLGHRPRCGTGFYCDPLQAKCKTAAAQGGGCDDSVQCAAPLQCHASKCDANPIGAAGVACDDDADDCAKGLFCDKPKGAKAGKCATKKGAGQACSVFTECQGDCRKAGDAGDKTCVAFCGSG